MNMRDEQKDKEDSETLKLGKEADLGDGRLRLIELQIRVKQLI